MAIATDPAIGGGAPFAKFANVGDTLIGAFAGSARRQQQDYETQKPKFKDDGRPLLEEIMHFVAMPGTTAGLGNLEEGLTPIEVASHVRWSVSGFKWKTTIDGRKALPEYAGFKAGTPCSGDVYTIGLTGWSAATDNPQGAVNAGFTVVEGRIVMRDEESHERWVLAQVKRGSNTNSAKDYELTIRRPSSADHEYERQADELFLSKWWEGGDPVMAGGGSSMQQPESEPFLDIGDQDVTFRDAHRWL